MWIWVAEVILFWRMHVVQQRNEDRGVGKLTEFLSPTSLRTAIEKVTPAYPHWFYAAR